MKRICLISTIFTLLMINSLNGQTKSPNIAADLEGMFFRLRDNLSSQQKLAINDSVKLIIESYAASDSVFNHRFTNLRYLGQISSPDNLVKIITWNLILNDGGNRYICYIIRKSDPGVQNTIYKLSGIYNESPIRTDTIYSESNWYGALYYDIRPFKIGKEPSYILLGIDYGNSFVTRKLIDVLTFAPGSGLLFGRNCFSDGIMTSPRVVFEFSANAVMSLRFYGDLSIVFDHLSPSSPELKDNRQYYGPDFSYDSYDFEKGLWRLKTNVDIRIK
jgi:hypothetical protein